MFQVLCVIPFFAFFVKSHRSREKNKMQPTLGAANTAVTEVTDDKLKAAISKFLYCTFVYDNEKDKLPAIEFNIGSVLYLQIPQVTPNVGTFKREPYFHRVEELLFPLVRGLDHNLNEHFALMSHSMILPKGNGGFTMKDFDKEDLQYASRLFPDFYLFPITKIQLGFQYTFDDPNWRNKKFSSCIFKDGIETRNDLVQKNNAMFLVALTYEEYRMLLGDISTLIFIF